MMGRSFNYTIRARLSEEEKKQVLDFTDKYNKMYEWEYENLHFLSDHLSEPSETEFKNMVKTLGEKESSDYYQTYFEYYSGSTKIYSNEINAIQIIYFTVELSGLFPDYEIYIEDSDGPALYCPLLIKNRLAKPYLPRLKKELGSFDKNGYEENPRVRYFKRILELQPNYGDIRQYIRPLKEMIQLPKDEKFKIDKSGSLENIIDQFIRFQAEGIKAYYNSVHSYPKI